MRIPKLIESMLIAIIALSSGLVMVRARAGAASGRFLELKYRIGPSGLAHSGRVDICVMRVDGSQKGNTCDFVDHGRDGLLLVNTRLTGKVDESAQLRIRAKYIPGDGDTEVDYSEALFKDIPEKVLPLEPSAKQEFEVAGLGKIEVEGEYLDHIPPFVYRPQDTLFESQGVSNCCLGAGARQPGDRQRRWLVDRHRVAGCHSDALRTWRGALPDLRSSV